MPEKSLLVPIEDLRLLRRQQVLDLVGLSASRIRQLEAAGRFPKRIALGDNAVAWLEKDIREWINTRIESGRVTPHGAAAGLHSASKGA